MELTLEEKAELFDKIASLVANYKPTRKKLPHEIDPKMTQSINHLLEDETMKEKYGENTLRAFCQYRSEADSRGKERWQKEKIFNIKMRLDRRKWNEETNFGKKEISDYRSLYHFDLGMRAGKQEEIKSKLGIEQFVEMKGKRKESEFYLK